MKHLRANPVQHFHFHPESQERDTCDYVTLPLSTRAYNCLRNANCWSLAEVRQATDQQLLSMENCGRATVNELRQIIGGKSSMTNGKYLIEKGIPFPGSAQGRRETWPYPFDDMEPGDSFFVPMADDDNADTVRSKITNKWVKWRKVFNRPDVQFTSRLQNGETRGMRVWRLPDKSSPKNNDS